MTDFHKNIYKSCKELWKALLAEFIGTLFLVLIGCGSTISNPKENFNEKLTFVEIGLCFGLSVGVIVHMIFHISGGHINPAVTVGMMICGNINVLKGVLYILVQVAGAIAGAALLFASIPDDYRSGLGVTSLEEKVNIGQGLEIEFLITFLLVFSVFMVMDPRKNVVRHEPLVVGLVVAACHIWAIKFTGSSMNPARSFGPALVKNKWDAHYIYWVGPILGGVVAALLYRFVFAPSKEELGEERESEQKPPSVEEVVKQPAERNIEKQDDIDVEALRETAVET